MKELLAIFIFLFVTDVIAASFAGEDIELTEQSLTFNNAVPDSALRVRIDWENSYIMTTPDQPVVAKIRCARPKILNSEKPFGIELFDKKTSKSLAIAKLPMSSEECFSILKSLADGTHELNIHTGFFHKKNDLVMAIEVRRPRDPNPKNGEKSFSGGFMESLVRVVGDSPPRYILTGDSESENFALAHCGSPRDIALGKVKLHLEVRKKTPLSQRIRQEFPMTYEKCRKRIERAWNGETRLEILADGSLSPEAPLGSESEIRTSSR